METAPRIPLKRAAALEIQSAKGMKHMGVGLRESEFVFCSHSDGPPPLLIKRNLAKRYQVSSSRTRICPVLGRCPPRGTAAFHSQTVGAGMLLQQRPTRRVLSCATAKLLRDEAESMVPNIDPEQVRKLAGWGLTQNDIASFVGWSQSLLSLRFSSICAFRRQAIKNGVEQGHGTQSNPLGMKDLWPSASRWPQVFHTQGIRL